MIFFSEVLFNRLIKKALCECLHHFPKILFLEKKAPDFLKATEKGLQFYGLKKSGVERLAGVGLLHWIFYIR